MSIDKDSVTNFSLSLKSKGKLPATVESYARDAQRFLIYLQEIKLSPMAVEPETLIHYQNYLVEKHNEKENSIRRTIIGVRQFYRHLKESNVFKDSPLDYAPIPERNDALPQDLKQNDIEQIIEQATASPRSFLEMRNALIIALLAYEGLKATELIALDWNDYLGGNPASLRIKGGRGRVLILDSKTVELFRLYQEGFAKYQSHPVIEAAKEKKIFIAFRGRDATIPMSHMSRHGLKFIIYELGLKAGIKHLHTELLRHYAVDYLLSQGKSPEEIMLHLGLRRLGNIAKHIHALNNSHVSAEP